MSLWAGTKWTDKYINVWAYYFGLAKAVREEFKNDLFDAKSTGNKLLIPEIATNKMKCLYLVCCLTELPDEGIYQQVKQVVLKNQTILDVSKCDLTSESLNVIFSFLSCYIVQHWEYFNLSNCSLDDDKLDKMLHLFMHKVKYMPKVDTLDLSSNQLTMKSLNGIFKIVYILNASKIVLSHNDKIEDIMISNYLLSFTETQFGYSNLKVVENNKTLFLFCQIDLYALQSMTTLTNLYVIRCTLDSDIFKKLVTVLRLHKNLLLLFLYDNNNKLLNGSLYEVLKFATNFLLFEKLLPDSIIDEISNMSSNCNHSQILLVSASKLLARGATDYQILTALEYNPSIVHLQLNDCNITGKIMSKIAATLNSSSQQWIFLDLSGSKINDDTLRAFCDVVDCNHTVHTINIANNKLTSESLSLIAKLIHRLKPSKIDICNNIFVTGNSKSASIHRVSVSVVQKVFAYESQLCLTLKCDNGNVLLCHKLDHVTIIVAVDLSCKFTQIFINDCTLSGETLSKLLTNDTLTLLHLTNEKWSGESFKNSVCEEAIPKEINSLVNKNNTDVKVSRVISTDNSFIAEKCSYELLNWHLTQNLLPLSTCINLFCVQNCLLDDESQNCCVISDCFDKQNAMKEIVLCNNGLSQKDISRIMKTLQKFRMLKSIFVCELQEQLCGNKIARQLLSISVCSFMVIGNKEVIGKQSTVAQIDRCFSLISPLTTTLRFISCNFDIEHSNTLVGILSRYTALEEFSFYECNTDSICTMQLVEALQMKYTLTSLLLSCNKVPSSKANSLANALSTIISNNPALEKVSFKLDSLSSSACGKIFQALSNIRHLKHFRFCDGQVTTKETMDRLKEVITNNLLLEVVNLSNNKLQSLGIKFIAEAFKTISHLKLLALYGNRINEEAADDIASIIDNNVKLEKLVLYNNAFKSEGICKICQALKNHRNLLVFRIGHNYIQEAAAEAIAKIISHNPLLKVVDIGKNRLLTDGVIKITSQLEKFTNLQKLYLSNNNITCTEAVTDSLSKVIGKNGNLKLLHLDNNNFSVSDVSMIAEKVNKLTGLRELTVNNTGFTADHISTMIANNLLLEILDISDNELESEGISYISKALMKLSRLRVLGLCGNNITGDAADDIARVISKLPVLEKLLLNNNNFGVAGIKSICESLQHNKGLKLLQLDNAGITEEVADDIAAVVDSNPLLEYIYLGNNALHNNGANVILNSLKNKKQFKALGLNNNGISEDIVDNVVQFIIGNPELEELLLNNNSIGSYHWNN